jgi:hypothetical protein
MNTPSSPPPIGVSPTVPRGGIGLAIASFVLGILGLLGSLVLVGALFGLVGLVLGAVHLLKRTGRNGFAWAGVALSIFSILASIGLAFVYVPAAKEFAKKIREEMAAAAAPVREFTDPRTSR